MDDHVYKVIQLVGSSEKSIEDAIQVAVRRASASRASSSCGCIGGLVCRNERLGGASQAGLVAMPARAGRVR